MGKKQYINSSNQAPSSLLGFNWLVALTVYVMHWPTWIYAVDGTLAFLFLLGAVARLTREEGIDVVNRD